VADKKLPEQLSLFDDLPDWPGNTPPKNRVSDRKVKNTPTDALNGARGKVYRIQGEDKEFFTIGELARALNRKAVTIRSWEQRGWLPKVKYRTPAPAGEQIPGKPSKGRRLYSRSQVEFLLEAVTKFNLDHSKLANWSGFQKHIRANWPAD
jgi:hypothetical protein